MRSKLFVPASRPALFAKALAGQADALSFDLEDAVAPERKGDARDALRAMLRDEATRQCGKVLIVRVNALDTPHFAHDVRAVAQPGLDLINLPKPETKADVLAAVAALEATERENGVTTPIRLLLNIESPAAVLNAAELACAHPRVAGLQLGLGDLFEPLGIARREPRAIEQAMYAVRMAAGVAGVYAYDSAFGNIKDEVGFRAEAELARAMGFLGKTCIHPSQIAICNDVFRPSDDDIAHAVRVVIATRVANRDGVGAYVVDGKMIDPPFAARAQAVVDDARRMALLSADQLSALDAPV